jgi:hypothetical protein
LYLVGSVVLVALAGCGRGFLLWQEREPWRHEAEVQCLKSGAVKEGPGIVRIEPISGPGICGADFPLKVAVLGQGNAYGYTDELRPPGAIAGGASVPPRWPIAGQPPPSASISIYTPIPADTRYGPPRLPAATAAPSGSPLSLTPPGLAPPSESVGAIEPSYGGPQSPYGADAAPQPYPPPLGPYRGPPVAGGFGLIEVKPSAVLACPLVSALDQWMSSAVQPAALRWFGQPVVAIKQISAYSCRGMNGQPGAHISEHAFGNALDIAAFTLADGRTVAVRTGWNGMAEEQGFLRDVEAAACAQFNTVLAPGSNHFHSDHIHVDLMRRASGRRVCNPGAVDGEEVAARAAQRSGAYARRRGDPFPTGSVSGARGAKAKHRAGVDDDDDYWVANEPPAPLTRDEFRKLQ